MKSMSRNTTKARAEPLQPAASFGIPPEAVANFDLFKVAELLIKEQGLHEGRFEVGFQFAIAVGKFGLQPGIAPVPGVLSSIGGLALLHAPADSMIGVDAATVNPRPAKSKPAAKKSSN